MNLHHMTTMSARVSVAAVLLLALGACGDKGAPVAGDDVPTASTTPSTSASDAPDTTSPSEDPTSADPATTEPTTAPTSEPTDQPAEVFAYAGGESSGVEVKKRSDASKLDGAPQSFKKFIGRTAAELAAAATCDDAYVGVTVEAVSTAGYAVGGVNDCGGYQAMWAVVDGSWKEIAGTQEAWDCAVLKRYRVPSEILLGNETCFDYDGDQKEHDYHQA